MHRTAILAISSTLAACAPVSGPPESPLSTDEDPYLWLEDVSGDRALRWVRQRNRETNRAWAERASFKGLRERLLAVFDSEDRIPGISKMGDYYYNFWRDTDHPRGVWRRTTLEEYRKADPDWETVLDLDALARKEKENWVLGGFNCRQPDYRRCLIGLSRGGADAEVVREFDIHDRTFVEDGFILPESKGTTAWAGPDSIFVATDFGAGTMTESGYPRIVKLWQRGTDLADGRGRVRRPRDGRERERQCRSRARIRDGAGVAGHRFLQQRPVLASRRAPDPHRQAVRRQRDDPPRSHLHQPGVRLDARRDDLRDRQPARRRPRSVPGGRPGLRGAVRAHAADVPRRLRADAQPCADQRARQRPQPRLRRDPGRRGLDAAPPVRERRLPHGQRPARGRPTTATPISPTPPTT